MHCGFDVAQTATEGDPRIVELPLCANKQHTDWVLFGGSRVWIWGSEIASGPRQCIEVFWVSPIEDNPKLRLDVVWYLVKIRTDQAKFGWGVVGLEFQGLFEKTLH